MRKVALNKVKRNFFERLFDVKPRCQCGKRMKWIEWPYEQGFVCLGCHSLLWLGK
jgi:hypothetical protein